MVWLRFIYRRYPIIGKCFVTLVILLTFMIGRYIPLPNTTLDTFLVAEGSILDMGAMLTGGNLSQIGLFSLGLGPWMYATLLVRLFAIGKTRKVISMKKQTFRQNSLMLMISAIQGFIFAVSLDYTGSQENIWDDVFEATLVLIAGGCILYWLSIQNAKYGFGGSTIIVLMNVLLGQKATMASFVELLSRGDYAFLIFISLWSLLMVYVSIVFEKAEYRIPVRKVSLDNELANEAYMPIKVTIAGGTPVMYAYSLLVVPQYLMMLMREVFPNLANWDQLSLYLTTLTIPGLMLVAVTIFLLSLSFAFISLDAPSQAEIMRNSGDYFEGVRPGKPTQRFISKKVLYMGIVYGTYLALVVTLPALPALGNPDTMQLSQITGILLVISGMVISVLQEFSIARLAKRYQSLFE